MKILIDLRSVDYGLSGGIENYAYYLIESIKKQGVELILDVPFTSRKKYKIDKRMLKQMPWSYMPVP